MTQPEKQRILFLDDEEDVLHSLRCALRRERGRWDMRFVTSGAEALASLEQSPAELIVSDMRMPGMNGAEFLRKASELLPRSVRIVLSGEAEDEITVRAIPFAHQWLAKPTERDDLVRVIERSLKTREVTQSGAAHAMVTSTNRLPILPSVYLELTALLSNDDASIESISDIIEHQPCVSARVLQLSNSAFFGIPRTIESIREAVTFLGFATISQLVLAAEVISQLEPSEQAFPMDQFLKEANATSAVASDLLGRGPAAHTAASAGLLHHIGQLVLAQTPELGASYIAECVGLPHDQWSDVEMRLFGATHADVGAALLAVWGLPHELVEAVAFQHDPDPHLFTGMEAAVAVHIAHTIVSHEVAKEQDGAYSEDGPRFSEGASAYLDGETLSRLSALARRALMIERAGAEAT
ncbi:Hydrogenase transcriptional regulatory protein hupR1 [Planctomycetes bacterium Poly30]|uniref:Hydrogenase transcriptional regulatory protein hupR1 n=1 Tax=Saltatorellus ferox TaxID=2528018 RepID=A0A518EZE4_9BACT|nr:Hydrogenase transcriptional regulatory protein hupR1 [Planctomycetes bacterium Poly30]